MKTKSELQGKIIITTQPADQAEALLVLLTQMGARAYNLPMVRTCTIDLSPADQKVLQNMDHYQLLVFTSKKGVKGFFENLEKYTRLAKLPASLEIATVGAGTAKEVEKWGKKVKFINPGTDAMDLAGFLNSSVLKKGDRVLLALGKLAPDVLIEQLSLKADITRLDVYETLTETSVDSEIAELIKSRRVDMCVFSSPSGFSNFLGFFGNVNGLILAATGTTTARCIEESGYEAKVIAPYPSPKEMAVSIKNYYKS
jgi:uroporphyrinogen-III synthase